MSWVRAIESENDALAASNFFLAFVISVHLMPRSLGGHSRPEKRDPAACPGSFERQPCKTDEGRAQLDAIKAELKAKKSAPETVHAPADVKWLEWSGTRNHPKATEMSASGATVTDRCGKFVEVKLTSGQTFRKGRDTRGFEVSVNGKRVIG